MTSNIIHRISNSRNNILDILEKHQEYDTNDYKEFSIHEIDTMYTNDQLDMLLTHKLENKKIYVKYALSSKPMRAPTIDNYIEDLFQIESILTKNDTLLVILLDEPSENIISHIKHLYNNEGYFVVILTINRLQYNLLDHELVPSLEILTDQDKQQVFKQYNIKNSKQLPEINRFDPQAQVMCMRPGDVGRFTRKSVTSVDYDYYRVCV